MDTDHKEEHRPIELLILSIISAAVYLTLTFLIFRYLHGAGFAEAFEHGYTFQNQFLIGIAAAGSAAAIISFIASRPPLSGVLQDFYIVEMISKLRLTTFDRIQLSAFAGAGEELLFRGAIQPLLGIWLTSIVFVGIHGYFKFKSIGHILFGLLMFGLSVLLGYLYEYVGLISAMTAHAVYDIIMLQFLQVRKKNSTRSLINNCPMYHFQKSIVAQERSRKYLLYKKEKQLRYIDFVMLIQQDEGFRSFFINLLSGISFRAYQWETLPVTKSTIDQPFEFVVSNNPAIDLPPDPGPFRSYFNGSDIAVFNNLGNDAKLIAPAPVQPELNYSHIGVFTKQAPMEQQQALWQRVGKEVRESLSDQALWLNTAGGGVAWLHVRLDSRPKYYRHRPYVHLN